MRPIDHHLFSSSILFQVLIYLVDHTIKENFFSFLVLLYFDDDFHAQFEIHNLSRFVKDEGIQRSFHFRL